MKKITRVACIALAAVMTVPMFASCSLGGKKPAEKQLVDHVYKYTEKVLYTYDEPKYYETYDAKAESKNETSEINDDFDGYTYVSNNCIGASGFAYVTEGVDKEYNSTGTVLHIGTSDGTETGTVQINLQNDKKTSTYINNLKVLNDGVAVVFAENTLVDEETYVYDTKLRLVIYDMQGTQKSEIDLYGAFGIDKEQYLYISNIVSNGVDCYISAQSDSLDGNSLYCIDAEGKIKGEPLQLIPEGQDGYVNSVFFIDTDRICITYETSSQDYTITCKVFNIKTGETTVLPIDDYAIMQNMFGGANGGVYQSDENGIYKIDTATGVQTELMNYINSDYIYNYGSFYAKSDDEFCAVSNSYDDGTNTLKLCTFTKVPDSEIKPKYIIWVASAGYSYNFRDEIVKFNLASDEYRMKYTNYSQYNTNDDYTAGATKLNNDILAGNIPDILIADSEFSVSKYMNKGLFADLYQFMENDEEVNKDAFLPNILKGCEVDGKIYELPTSYQILGFMGIKDKIAEYANLTMSEFAQKVNALPEGTTFTRATDGTRDQMFRMMFFINYVNFINRATGQCSLDNDDFKAILEYVKDLPEKSVWDDPDYNYEDFDWDAYQNAFKTGAAIAEVTSLSSFSSFEQYAYEFGNNEIDFIGAPAPDRDGMVFTATDLKFLISAKGAFQDEAWNFVRLFFVDEYQSEGDKWGFSVTKYGLNAQKEEALKTIEERKNSDSDGSTDGGMVYISSTGAESPAIYPSENDSRDMTPEDVETIYNYAVSACKNLEYDESVFNIVNEEASAYFSGQKSLDEVASLIESRVNVYINESR